MNCMEYWIHLLFVKRWILMAISSVHFNAFYVGNG